MDDFKSLFADFQRGQRAMLGPAWRWKLALALPRRQAHRSVQGSDPLVRDARGYLTLIERGPRGITRANQIYAAIAAAVTLNTDSVKTASLKIMSLAGCAPSEIQARLGIAPDVGAIWEQLYFDVRDQLAAVGWLSSQVIEVERRGGNGQLAAQLKLAAVGGAAAARALLDAESRVPVDEGQRLFDRQVKLGVKFDQAIDMPLASSADSIRFLRVSTQLELQLKRLELDRQKLAEHCREAVRRHEVVKYRMQQVSEREQRRAAERTRKSELRAQRCADIQRWPERRPEIEAQQRLRARKTEEARAAASCLAQLRWGGKVGTARAEDKSRRMEAPVFTRMVPVVPDSVPALEVGPSHAPVTMISTWQDTRPAVVPVETILA